MKNIDKIKRSIKESAIELFDKFGYDKTTLEDIAKRTDRAKTSIYYHFGGKIDILREAVEDEFADIREKLSGYQDLTPGHILLNLKSYLVERMTCMQDAKTYRKFAVNAMLDGTGEVNRTVRQIRTGFDEWERKYFVDICTLGCKWGVLSESVRPEAFGDLMLMLLKGLEMQFIISDDPTACKQTYDEIVERLLGGMFAGVNNESSK